MSSMDLIFCLPSLLQRREFMKHSSSIVKSNCVLNVDVINPQKENLGKIEEIMINKTSGQVAYVVLSFGGFLGVGDKLFALPWNAIHYSPEDESFILNIDKKRLEEAPGFNKDQWPDMADVQWQATIQNFYRTSNF